MPIKNYTTKVPAERTVLEIEKILTQHGASHILKEYGSGGKVLAVTFKIKLSEERTIAFRLPLMQDKLKRLVNKIVSEKLLPRRYLNDEDKALRIGWRIIKDWIDAQMALVELELADLDEVFLPYAMHSSGQTLYEVISKANYDIPLLESHKEKPYKGVD